MQTHLQDSTPNSPMEIFVENEHVVIPKKKYKLSEFLKQINEVDLHNEAFSSDDSWE
jgi:hypothetical protein